MPPKKSKPIPRFFIPAQDDAQSARRHADTPQCRSASYKLAYQDEDFILRDELRPVRLQLELLKPELILQENHIESTVVIFGSARIADPATAEARLVSAEAEYRDNKKILPSNKKWIWRGGRWPTASIMMKPASWAPLFPITPVKTRWW